MTRFAIFLVPCVALLYGALIAPAPVWAKKKKTEEELTQQHEVPKDPPAAILAETQRLTFLVTPLSNKGLLSAQIRDGLKALIKQANGGAIVKVRAFTAGRGDLRRVPAIVSEIFTEKKLALPAVSTIQVGALPLEGAQVSLEAYAVAKKPVNPNGLAFISGVGISTKNALDPVLPLLDRSMADLAKAVKYAGSEPSDVTRITCLFSSLDGYPQLHAKIAAAFPNAALASVQPQRSPDGGLAECEAVARLRTNPGDLKFLRPADMNPSPAYSKMALVGAPKVIFTSEQMGFGYEEKDVRLAFERMKKALEGARGSMNRVAFSSLFPLGAGVTAKVRAVRSDYYDKDNPPASTMVLFEGLPSMDASFSIDLIAVP